MGFVYILKGKLSGRIQYYIGSTKRQIEVRIKEHMRDEPIYTRKLTNKENTFFMEIAKHRTIAVENYLKKHRLCARALGGGKKSPNGVKNFKSWLDKYGIKIRSVGRILSNGEREYFSIDEYFPITTQQDK